MPGTPNIVAIVHGKSEDILVKGLGVRMGLRVMTFSRNGGNENIAMSALPRILSRDPFDSEISLHRRFPMLEYYPRKIPRIPDLGLYPVMDHDGDDRNLRGYISGDLLRGCPLHNRIVPIINRPDLDSGSQSDVDAMADAINEAIDALVPKPEVPPTDPDDDNPPFPNWGNDDDNYVPIPPVVVDDGDDESLWIFIVLGSVAASLFILFIIFDRRDREN